jgi:hypothetical protein
VYSGVAAHSSEETSTNEHPQASVGGDQEQGKVKCSGWAAQEGGCC